MKYLQSTPFSGSTGVGKLTDKEYAKRVGIKKAPTKKAATEGGVLRSDWELFEKWIRGSIFMIPDHVLRLRPMRNELPEHYSAK